MKINLDFTVDNLEKVLQYGCELENLTYSHCEIADWCSRFVSLIIRDDQKMNKVQKIMFDIAYDVDAQWEMNLFNTYSLDDLKSIDFESIRMPIGWFNEWIKELKSAQQLDTSETMT